MSLVQPVPPPSPDDDPFTYPFREIVAHFDTRYPPYLWGTLCAAQVGAVLGYERISVIELGVAGGNGLLELERIAAWAGRRAGIQIDVHGFDTGTGLPKPADYRDVPHLWSEGHFGMDVDALRRRLSGAQLHLGPVAETVPAFIETNPAPIGFISFDLDLYSSTTEAFGLFRGGNDRLLPRVVCYFDDIIGFSHGDFTGERLAIAEYNEGRPTHKLSKVYGLRYVVEIDQWWTDMIYMHHVFDHPLYNEWDGSNVLRELPLARP